MNEAKQEFKQFIETFHFAPLSFPVISNVYAEPYQQERLKETLSQQMNSTVRWTDSIRYLMGRGAMEFEEVGPGKVLTGLITRIKNEAEPLTHHADSTEKNASNGQQNEQAETDAHLARMSAEITAHSLGSAEFKKTINLHMLILQEECTAELLRKKWL